MIERSVILCEGDTLTVDLLPLDFYMNTSSSSPVFDMVSVEKNHIRKMLNYTKGNKAEAARLMEIGLTTLYRKLDEYGLN